jgi:UTP--glucose-1-phosphate uridylyltransferase
LIRKAVIPAAGWGTRFLPATKAQPKETLPLFDRPMIHYIVEEAAAVGIRQIIMVTALGKRAIEDYFDRSYELEQLLQAKGDEKRLAEVRRISEMAEVVYVRQREQLGLGHAILTAKDLVGNEPFAVFLPDDVVEAKVPAIRQLLNVYERYRCSVLAVERVPDCDVGRYGIIQGREVGERTFQIERLVEKPKLNEAPSNLAVIGRYILTPDVFAMLERARPGAIGEIQLTDGLDALLGRQNIYAYEYEGVRHDGGTPLGLLRASVAIALNRPDVGGEFRQWLHGLLTGASR